MTVSTHPSNFKLDALAMNALPADESSAIQNHLIHCPSCQEYLRQMDEFRQHFRQYILPRTSPQARRNWIRQLLESRRSWAFIAAPALAVALLIAVRQMVVQQPSLESEYGIKGGAAFKIFAQRGEKVFQVTDGTPLKPRDEIRFLVEAAGLPYVLIASIDGLGHASVYFPYAGKQSAAIDPKVKELPTSIILDEAPGPERVFALFSKQPLSSSDVTAVLAKIGAQGADSIRTTKKLPLAANDQLSILFEKTNRAER